eukprot:6146264-Prymnesium_polylepis.1
MLRVRSSFEVHNFSIPRCLSAVCLSAVRVASGEALVVLFRQLLCEQLKRHVVETFPRGETCSNVQPFQIFARVDVLPDDAGLLVAVTDADAALMPITHPRLALHL